MPLRDLVLGLFRRKPRTEDQVQVQQREQVTHVIILDGTMSRLDPGYETNAGLIFKLLREASRTIENLTIHYEAGIQWKDWTETLGVVAGRGINRQIERAYGVLCSRYNPGDRIVLIGYSRGAFAVRSLAGVVERVGLVERKKATSRNIRTAYRYYQKGTDSPQARHFIAANCVDDITIDAVGVFDTVKSLGLRLPFIWRFEQSEHAFHSDGLEPCVRAAFQALALDETRVVFSPELWRERNGWNGHVEQVWFRGTHAVIGGQIAGRMGVRKLSNIPLVWMLEHLEESGLRLPPNWRGRFPCDPDAPAIGGWAGWGKLFWVRKRRVVGQGLAESIHPSVKKPVKA